MITSPNEATSLELHRDAEDTLKKYLHSAKEGNYVSFFKMVWDCGIEEHILLRKGEY